MKMNELYEKHLNGEKFKEIKDIKLGQLPVRYPVDLVGENKTMKRIALKHSRFFK